MKATRRASFLTTEAKGEFNFSKITKIEKKNYQHLIILKLERFKIGKEMINGKATILSPIISLQLLDHHERISGWTEKTKGLLLVMETCSEISSIPYHRISN